MSGQSVDELGRIVVVAAGFALWLRGKCIAAARFSDITRLSAYRPDGDKRDGVMLVVQLKDGSKLEYHEAIPGFDAFLDRASATLPGLLPIASWHAATMLEPAGGDGRVIFERPPPAVSWGQSGGQSR